MSYFRTQEQHCEINSKLVPNLLGNFHDKFNIDQENSINIKNEKNQISKQKKKFKDITNQCQNESKILQGEKKCLNKISIATNPLLFMFNDSDNGSSEQNESKQSKKQITINQRPRHLFLEEMSDNQCSQKSEIKQETVSERIEDLKGSQINLTHKQLDTVQFRNIVGSNYMFESLNQGFSLDCFILRNIVDSQYHVYDMKTLTPILMIRKKMRKFIFYEKYQQKYGWNKMGCIKAIMKINLIGDSFNLLKYKNNKKEQDQYLIKINYETNLFGMNGPRQMNIYIPNSNKCSEQNMDEIYEKEIKKKVNNPTVRKFINKSAKWNPKMNSYTLNLYHKARFSSVKNFVIVQNQETDKYQAIFGKNGENTFRLSICSPFNIMQALAVAMSSFSRKIISQ